MSETSTFPSAVSKRPRTGGRQPMPGGKSPTLAVVVRPHIAAAFRIEAERRGLTRAKLGGMVITAFVNTVSLSNRASEGGACGGAPDASPKGEACVERLPNSASAAADVPGERRDEVAGAPQPQTTPRNKSGDTANAVGSKAA